MIPFDRIVSLFVAFKLIEQVRHDSDHTIILTSLVIVIRRLNTPTAIKTASSVSSHPDCITRLLGIEKTKCQNNHGGKLHRHQRSIIYDLNILGRHTAPVVVALRRLMAATVPATSNDSAMMIMPHWDRVGI